MQSVPASTTAEAADQPRILTRRDADQLSVYEAVSRWLNREPSFMHDDDPEHHLEELTLMTMTAEWLTRWQPISMHRAILAGASPSQVAAAAGLGVRELFEQWRRWADGQRGSIIAGCPGVTEDEYVAVQRRFVENRAD